ncbi:ribosomal large subunit pseudouridine synthase A [Alcanivorax xiamenensis]|uniref:Dual-specificity RNA pseudouridine synthase RluA n=1 Tax=Alcanivorax xiamenensis TaxID=1177156 RepID=A0ABQ6Y9U5_9GAMM|nr:ribosomal large subunit pseudouridine synthase A [Alcanivorax xiamenensis]
MRLPRARQPEHYIVPRCHEEVVILHRDDHLLVVNKPAFLLSVPGRAPENKDCVIRRLAVDFPEIRLVHRLDLDTSGIMVFALTREAQSQLSRAFQQRRVFKEYQAVVDGLVEYGDGAVDLPLIADWPNRPLQKVCFETGKVALTQWKVLERDTVRGRTRLRLRPAAYSLPGAGASDSRLRSLRARSGARRQRAVAAACPQAGLQSSSHRTVERVRFAGPLLKGAPGLRPILTVIVQQFLPCLHRFQRHHGEVVIVSHIGRPAVIDVTQLA